MTQQRLNVKGLSCEHCVQTVKQALEKIAGVAQARVSLDEGTAEVELSESVSPDRLVQAVRDAGYDAETVA